MSEEKDAEFNKDEVQQLLSDARLNKLNIFHDRNAIIAKLCQALLKSWDRQ